MLVGSIVLFIGGPLPPPPLPAILRSGKRAGLLLLPWRVVLALKVVVEVEGVSEVLAAAAAPQFGPNLLQVPLFLPGGHLLKLPQRSFPLNLTRPRLIFP